MKHAPQKPRDAGFFTGRQRWRIIHPIADGAFAPIGLAAVAVIANLAPASLPA